jgi:hypothetical protein
MNGRNQSNPDAPDAEQAPNQAPSSPPIPPSIAHTTIELDFNSRFSAAC